MLDGCLHLIGQDVLLIPPMFHHVNQMEKNAYQSPLSLCMCAVYHHWYELMFPEGVQSDSWHFAIHVCRENILNLLDTSNMFFDLWVLDLTRCLKVVEF